MVVSVVDYYFCDCSPAEIRESGLFVFAANGGSSLVLLSGARMSSAFVGFIWGLFVGDF